MAEDSSWVEAMPEFYDRCLGPALFAPCARHVAEIVAAHAPRSVLELAAGTGILTAELLRVMPSAQITATDLNPAMVSWGAQRAGGASWQQADAQSLEFADDSFDLVVCQFGVMFFPDRAGAHAEVARVLRPDGHFVFSAWDAVDTSAFPAALVSSLAELFPGDAPDFIVRVPHGYHDSDQIRADVQAGGLVLHNIERFVLPGIAPSARSLAHGYCYGSPIRFELEKRGNLDELAEAVAEGMTERLGTGVVESDLTGFIVTARRP